MSLAFRYSAEVAGTIIVQSIPVLRPFVKDLKTSLTSRKLSATAPSGGKGSNWRSSTFVEKKDPDSVFSRNDEEGQQQPGSYELKNIPEETPSQALKLGYSAGAYFSPSEVDLRIDASHTKPIAPKNDTSGHWPL